MGFGTLAADIGIQHGQGGDNFIQGFDGAERSTTLKDNNMYSLTGMVAGTSASTIYQNGRSEATSPQTKNDASMQAGRLGNHGSVTSLEWRGAIRAVLVWNAELNAADIQLVKEWADFHYGVGLPQTQQIVFHGDSITAGTGVESADAYPQQLGRLRGWDFDGINAGFPGVGIVQLTTEATTDIDPAYDATTYSSANICCLLIGTNDLSVGTSAATILTNIQTYVTARQSTGWTVLVGTITPQSGITGAEETERVSLNASIVANTGSWHDGVMDFDGDSRLQDETDTTYFDADQVHLNETGYGVMASICNTALGLII
jgi:lysophospholipase L1-like esterase